MGNGSEEQENMQKNEGDEAPKRWPATAVTRCILPIKNVTIFFRSMAAIQKNICGAGLRAWIVLCGVRRNARRAFLTASKI